MRITNPMMTSRMLLNINRNMRQVDTLYYQQATGKVIQYPSDNPIIASRALKLRTIIAETKQYQRNVKQGLSWMELTQDAFINVTKIMESIDGRLVEGSSDPSGNWEDRKNMVKEIEQFIQQLSKEMNISYAGRYVFSGYRTDQPPILEVDDGSKYNITQTFNANDIEQTKSWQLLPDTVNVPPVPSEPLVYDVNILKLPYSGSSVTVPAPTNPPTPPTVSITVPGLVNPKTYTINTKSIHDVDAYTPPDNEVYFIEETGEMVLGKDAFHDLKIQGSSMDITYEKDGVKKGELNPRVNFDCVLVNDPANPRLNGTVYTMNNQNLEFEFGMNTRIPVNVLGKDVYTDKMFADFKVFIDFVNNVQLSNAVTLREQYAKGGFGTPPAAPITDPVELQKAVDEHMSREKQAVETVFQNRFKNILGLVQDHAHRISNEETNLGTRIERLGLIYDRLKQDEGNYEELKSDNEDIDMIDVVMKLKAAEAVYQASMMTGARIMQISLVDYLK